MPKAKKTTKRASKTNAKPKAKPKVQTELKKKPKATPKTKKTAAKARVQHPTAPRVARALSQARLRAILNPPKGGPPGPPGPPSPPAVTLTSLSVNDNDQIGMGAPVVVNLHLQSGDSPGTYLVRVIATIYQGSDHGSGNVVMNDWVEMSTFVTLASAETKTLDLNTPWLWPSTTNADKIFNGVPTMFLVTIWTQDDTSILAHGRLLPNSVGFSSS